MCTGNNWWGCERTGSVTNILNPIQSARIRTVNSFAFKYGRVEIEAKMPTGDWLWPAIWMLPKHNAYGQWPASGEIDIVEARGNRELYDSSGTHVGIKQMGSTMHWGPYWPQNGYPLTHATKTLTTGDFGSSFHKYEVEWTENDIKFKVDDETILTVAPDANGFWEMGDFGTKQPGIDNPWAYSSNHRMAPFDQEFYLILNVAVGGTNFFHDGFTGGNAKPWANASPTAARDFYDAKSTWYPTWNPNTNNGEDAAMQVNYIKVWAN